jgi:tRNA(fMet)-specific endonuclease VapC
MILLDTDHLSVLTKRQAGGHARLIERLQIANEPLAIPILSVEEQCKGWLAKIHRTRDIHQQIAPYDRLTEFFEFLAEWDIVSLDAAAADAFDHLRKQKIRIGSRDLKIASISLTRDALLLSANLRDFQLVPGLRVENWLRAD